MGFVVALVDFSFPLASKSLALPLPSHGTSRPAWSGGCGEASVLQASPQPWAGPLPCVLGVELSLFASLLGRGPLLFLVGFAPGLSGVFFSLPPALGGPPLRPRDGRVCCLSFSGWGLAPPPQRSPRPLSVTRAPVGVCEENCVSGCRCPPCVCGFRSFDTHPLAFSNL